MNTRKLPLAPEGLPTLAFRTPASAANPTITITASTFGGHVAGGPKSLAALRLLPT